MFNYVCDSSSLTSDETKRYQTVSVRNKNTPKIDREETFGDFKRVKPRKPPCTYQLAGRTKGQRKFARTRTQTRNGVKFPAEHRKYSRQVALLTLQRNKAATGLNREDDGRTGKRALERLRRRFEPDRSQDSQATWTRQQGVRSWITDRVSRRSSERLTKRSKRQASHYYSCIEWRNSRTRNSIGHGSIDRITITLESLDLELFFFFSFWSKLRLEFYRAKSLARPNFSLYLWPVILNFLEWVENLWSIIITTVSWELFTRRFNSDWNDFWFVILCKVSRILSREIICLIKFLLSSKFGLEFFPTNYEILLYFCDI